MKQKAGQSAIDYMACVELKARRAEIEGDQLRCIIIQGLLPNTRQFVVTRDGNDINSLRKWLAVAMRQQYRTPKKTSERSQGHPETFARDARTRGIFNRSNGEGVADGTQGTIHGALSIIVNVTRRLGPESFGVCQRKLVQR